MLLITTLITKLLKRGVDIRSGELIDFENNKNGFKDASIVLLGYGREVEEMPYSRERKRFINNVEVFASDYDISVREWETANSEFLKLRDEYELEGK